MRIEVVRTDGEEVRVVRAVRRRRPVVTVRTGIVHIRAVAAASSRQKDGTCGFHYCPLFEGVGVVGIVTVVFVLIIITFVCQALRCAGNKRCACRQIPVVRKQNSSVYSIYTAQTKQGSSVSTSEKQIIPLVAGQCTPCVGLVAAVSNRINAPVGKIGIVGIILTDFIRCITSSPTEEIAVVVRLGISKMIPLIGSKLPRTDILQVTLRELNNVAFRINGKSTF